MSIIIDNMEGVKNYILEHKKIIIATSITVGVLIVLVAGGLITTETYHKDRIFHGVSIGPVDVGGLKKDDAKTLLETWHDNWWNEQMNYAAYDENGEQLTTVDFYPLVVVEGNGQSYEFIWFDLEKMFDNAYQQGRASSLLSRVFNQIYLLIRPVSLDAVVTVEDDHLRQVLRLELSEFESLPQDAKFELSSPQADPEVFSEQSGNTFDYESAIAQTKDQLIRMGKGVIPIYRSSANAEIVEADVAVALEQLESLESSFPLKLEYLDERIGFERKWTLRWDDVYQSFLADKTDDGASLMLSGYNMDDYWEAVERLVNVKSMDAKFAIGEDNKVEQFQPSQKGYEFNRDETARVINEFLINPPEEEEGEPVVLIVVNVIEPVVSTADVNELGITEVLGTGYSNYSGSPVNRVHNIGVGADKLNGLLIKPGEEFSLLKALKPFTLAGGYLPELVIKGDKIIPEIGGGLCQIGSTTFRATMNSGLNVTQRRNHSLVVSYYNDPRNGNPGTDATIYDPAPDFRFINDTGNYILFETSMNNENGDLVFTFWGTSDGREAEYSEPVVTRWIPAGATKIVETTDLAPGVRKCQGAHPGANTSFTYTITRPDGSIEETVYTSSYRSLPVICLVGIDPDAPKEGEGEEDAPQDEAISDLLEDVISSEPVEINPITGEPMENSE